MQTGIWGHPSRLSNSNSSLGTQPSVICTMFPNLLPPQPGRTDHSLHWVSTETTYFSQSTDEMIALICLPASPRQLEFLQHKCILVIAYPSAPGAVPNCFSEVCVPVSSPCVRTWEIWNHLKKIFIILIGGEWYLGAMNISLIISETILALVNICLSFQRELLPHVFSSFFLLVVFLISLFMSSLYDRDISCLSYLL